LKLFFRHYGTGNPVVILHGLFGISDNWVTFGRRLADHFEVFIPDMRNHGHSPHSQVFDFPSLAEDLFEFSEDHRLKQFILLGHSLGGKTAMEFSLNYPERVQKIIVVDISMRKYKGNSEHQQLINAMISVDFSNVNSRSDIDKQLSETIHSPRLRQFLLKNVYRRDKTTMSWLLNLKSINENLPAIFDHIKPGIPYPGPALFIRGELSDYIIEDDMTEIVKNFPGALLKTVTGASHWVHADAPEEFYNIVWDFITSDQNIDQDKV